MIGSEKTFKNKAREIIINYGKDVDGHGWEIPELDEALEALDTLFKNEVRRIIGEKLPDVKHKTWLDGMADKRESYKNNAKEVEATNAVNRNITLQRLRAGLEEE